jgi:hypothetical protein
MLVICLFIGISYPLAEAAEKTDWKDKINYKTAWAASKLLVKKRLEKEYHGKKYKETAVFPDSNDKDVQIKYIGNQRYEVKAWVDHETNTMGLLRRKFTITVRRIGEEEWQTDYAHLYPSKLVDIKSWEERTQPLYKRLLN